MGPCPILTSRLARLQENLPENVKLVTFTVDPNSDTLPALLRYGKRFNADFDRWYFVRGQEGELKRLLNQGFQLAMSDNSNSPMAHTTKLVLVDQAGKIRSYYDSDFADSFTAVLKDALALAKK